MLFCTAFCEIRVCLLYDIVYPLFISDSFIQCVAWEKLAEVISQYVSKGKKIAVEGRIQTRSYEKDGRKNYVTEVIVQSMEFCENRRNSNAGGAGEYPGTAVPDEDIPF